MLHYDPYGTRTRVTAVKGRCLNRLTNGPLAPQVGFEPTTYRLTAGCSTTELLRNVTFCSEHFYIVATFFLSVNAFLKKFLATISCLVAVVLTTSIIYHAPK